MSSLLELILSETGPLLQLCFPFHQNSSSAQRFETSVHSFVNMHGLFMLNVTFSVYECFRVSSSLCFLQCHWLFAKVWQSLCEKVRTNFPVPHFKVLTLSQGLLCFELFLLVFFKDFNAVILFLIMVMVPSLLGLLSLSIPTKSNTATQGHSNVTMPVM